MQKPIFKPARVQGMLIDRQQLNEHFIQLKLAFNACLQYQPGQYINIRIGNQFRAYSICSFETKGTMLDICIDTAPGGIGSDFAKNAKLTTEFEAIFPLGQFVLSESDLPAIFMATGSGIAPFRSMIVNFLQKHPEKKVILLWGMRTEADLFWQNLWQKLSEKYVNFEYYIYLSKQKVVSRPFSYGHIGDFLDKAESLENFQAYICGNQQMVEQSKQKLQDKGLALENIYHERFY